MSLNGQNCSFFYTNRLYLIPIFVSFSVAFLSFGSLEPLATFGDDYFTYINGLYRERLAVKIGRWSTLIVWKAFGDNVFFSPVSLIVILFSMAASGVIVGRLFGVKSLYYLSLISACFVVSPLWLDVVSFKMRHISFSFMILVSVSIVFVYWKLVEIEKERYALFLIPFIAFVVGIYPAAISIIGVLFLFKLMSQFDLKLPSKLKILISFLIIGVLGVVLWFCITKITMDAYGLQGVSDGPYSLTGGVVSDFVQLKDSIKEVYEICILFFIGESYGMPMMYSILAFLFVSISFLVLFIKQEDNASRLFVLFVFLLLPIAALTVTVVKVSWPHRFSLYIPISIIFVCSLCCVAQVVGNKVQDKIVLVALMCVLVFPTVFFNAKEVFSSNAGWNRDYAFANRLLSKIEVTNYFTDAIKSGRKIPVEVTLVYDKRFLKNKRLVKSNSIGSSIHNCHILVGCQTHHLIGLLNRIYGKKVFVGLNTFNVNKRTVEMVEVQSGSVIEKDDRIIAYVHLH